MQYKNIQYIKNKIFEPFFTTKKHGEGIGLGLDITKKIINQLGGKIEFESVPSPQPLNFIEQKAGVNSGSVKNKTAIILSEDEKRKLLDEVEKQQTEFGVKK